MKLTSEQQKIIDLINQLPDNLKENTVNIISQMHASTETTKKDLTDAMVSPTMNEKGKEMLEKYNATKKIVDEFHQFCLKLSEKEETDFWDKTALSILAINNLAIPLFNVWDKEVWLNNKSDDLIESFKTDALQLAVLWNFLSNVLEGKSLESFKNDLNVEIPKAIWKYNSKVCNNTTAQLDIMLDKNLINILIYIFNKLEKLKKHEEFTNKMWDNFVKEFKEKLEILKEQMKTRLGFLNIYLI